MKSYTVHSFLGAGPGDQEASYWTQEDWDRHDAYVAKLKEEGRYGKPTTTNFICQEYPEFGSPTTKMEF